MQQVAGTEHLSTVGDLNPLHVLEPFGEAPVILAVVAVWTRDVMTGCLEEKGQWVHSFWDAALLALPGAAACRLGWNTIFFALPNEDVTRAVRQFGELLQSVNDPRLTSFSVLCEAAGSLRHKVNVLDVLGHEVGSERDFGSSPKYLPNGHRFYQLRDGEPFTIK